MNPSLLFLFLSAVAASLLITPLFIRLAHRHGLLDHPGHRKIHLAPVAKIGGLSVLTSLFLAAGLGILLFPENFNWDHRGKMEGLWILATASLAAFLGFWDDLYDLKPRHKFALQSLLLGTFVLFGFRFEVLHLPGLPVFELSFLAVPFTLFWLLAVVNGFNFIDGLDGLAGSVTVASLLGLGAVSYFLGVQSPAGLLWIPALGALLVFLAFNWKPARVYLGDAGSNAMAVLIGTSLVTLEPSGPGLFSFPPQQAGSLEPFRFQFLAATLMVGYPMIEIALSTFRRGTKRFLLGRSMEASEREHIHHYLLKSGLTPPAVCFRLGALQCVLAAAGLLVILRQNALATWLLVPLFIALGYWAPRLGLFDFLSFAAPRQQPHYRVANHFISMQKVKLDLARTREEILSLVNQTCHEFGIRSCRLIIRPDERGLGGMDYSQEWNLEEPAEYLGFIHDSAKTKTGGFSDHYKLSGGRGGAHWDFEPHSLEEDLDVEYHVLVSDFMRSALEVGQRLGTEQATLEVPGTVAHKVVSGHALRKRRRTGAGDSKN